MIPQCAAEDRIHIRDDPARLHFDEDVSIARLRPFDLVNAQWLSRLMQTRRSHACGHYFTPTMRWRFLRGRPGFLFNIRSPVIQIPPSTLRRESAATAGKA
jgi:hypothetical protein